MVSNFDTLLDMYSKYLYLNLILTMVISTLFYIIEYRRFLWEGGNPLSKKKGDFRTGLYIISLVFILIGTKLKRKCIFNNFTHTYRTN